MLREIEREPSVPIPAPAQPTHRRTYRVRLRGVPPLARRASPPPVPRSRPRATVLRKLLVGADAAGGALGAGVGAAVAGCSGAPLAASILVLVALWPVLTWACGMLGTADLTSWASGIADSGRLVLAVLLHSWASLAVLEAVGAPHPLPGALAAATATGLATSALRTIVRVDAHRRPALRERTVILGSGMVADRLESRLRSHDELGLQLIGIVDDKPLGPPRLDVPRLGGLADLPRILVEHQVDRVMFAFTRAGHDEMLRALQSCRDAGVAVDVVPRLFDFMDGARTLDQIGGLPLLSIEPRSLTRGSRAAKRALDIVGAGLGLLVLSPVLLAAAAAIRLGSSGPVLFRQTRVGRGGRHFTLYKFRSMYVGSPVLVRDDGAIVKGGSDPRVTPVGALLRRLSVDELPQLLNVLRGDMSLVGPRPLVLAEDDTLTEDWQRKRADLRPGLTGPWQVAGRSNIPFHEMIRFDYQYVSGWSLGRDLAIILATLPAVLSGRGAC